MANIKWSLVNTLIVLVLISFLVDFGQPTITTFKIMGGEEVAHPMNLIVEDRALIIYRVVEKANELQFSISFPNDTVKDFDASGSFSYSFICDIEGEYVLKFVNTGQTEKTVYLNYEVQHYIFGIPQMLFMTIIIVLACVVGVAAFVALGRRTY
jgi:hypothetical protein